MSIWTGVAMQLADDIREPGFAIAGLCAAAWSARVDPQACHGLVGAALTLTDGDASAALWAKIDPVTCGDALLSAAAELEVAVAELLGHATAMAAACRDARAAAVRDYQAAAADSTSEDKAVRAAARDRMAAARAAIADCDAALEIIDSTGGKLAHAANCLRQVPDDLEATYELPYAFIRGGGTLPHDGDFLTAGVSYEAA